MITNVTNEFDIDLGEMYRIEGREEIKPYLDRVWNILQESYAYIGGFKTFDDKKSLQRGYKFAFLYFNENKLCACAIFSGAKNVSGNKLIGIGAFRDSPTGVLAVHSIIRYGIKHVKANYWLECSGKVEELCKQYNGYPIPNIYVETLFKPGTIQSYSSDNFHYTRIIKNIEQPVEKCIFGFHTPELYYKIKTEMGEVYEEFKESANHVTESIIDSVRGRPDALEKAIYFYKKIWEMHYIEGYNELTQDLYDVLVWCVDMISKNKEQTKEIGDPYILLNEVSVLKLHKFNFD